MQIQIQHARKSYVNCLQKENVQLHEISTKLDTRFRARSRHFIELLLYSRNGSCNKIRVGSMKLVRKTSTLHNCTRKTGRPKCTTYSSHEQIIIIDLHICNILSFMRTVIRILRWGLRQDCNYNIISGANFSPGIHNTNLLLNMCLKLPGKRHKMIVPNKHCNLAWNHCTMVP